MRKVSSQHAFRVFIALSFIGSMLFWMVFTANSLYYIETAHLDALQLVLVGTTLEASAFLFEIPTGVVADVYSRRLSIIIGYGLIGAGFILEGSWASFLPILCAQVLWGLGFTFTSGATQAWISDEIGEKAANNAFLQSSQASLLGSLAGVLAGSLLGTISLRLPMLIGGGLFIFLSIMLILIMPETGFNPQQAENRSTGENMLNTLRNGLKMVRKRPALVNILAAGWFFGFYSEGVDRLWLAHLVGRFDFPYLPNIVWVGIIEAAAMLLSFVALEVVKRFINMSHIPSLIKFQAFSAIAIVVSLATYALSRNLAFSIGLYLFFSILREVTEPMYDAWVNTRLDSEVRATVLSMSSQVNALGQIAGGPLVGVIARAFSTTAGLLTSSALLVPVLGVLMRSRKTEDKNS